MGSRSEAVEGREEGLGSREGGMGGRGRAVSGEQEGLEGGGGGEEVQGASVTATGGNFFSKLFHLGYNCFCLHLFLLKAFCDIKLSAARK